MKSGMNVIDHRKSDALVDDILEAHVGRQWSGIDITPLSISLIEKRPKDAFPGIQFEVHGTPKDLEGARDLANRNECQFQWWAVSLVDDVPFGGEKKGADGRPRRTQRSVEIRPLTAPASSTLMAGARWGCTRGAGSEAYPLLGVPMR